KRRMNHHLPSLYKGEQRGVLEVEVEWKEGGTNLLFLATHLDYRPKEEERLASAKMIEKLVSDGPKLPGLLAGDLNATPDSETLKQVTRTWKIAEGKDKLLTYPSKEPKKHIDYVLFRPTERWKVVEVKVLNEEVASDHRPILAVLELSAE
ncbi:MAG: endonuclease/exonuclease/phosphatase family protein, partial [Acidobacteria bacterium]|nr:endonuclease/exonuclease/phosphatase family protein [Acidobacteriota bacterium]